MPYDMCHACQEDAGEAWGQTSLQDDQSQEGLQTSPVSELAHACICAYSPEDGSPRAFQTMVLPFGARAAAMGFCRTSYAIGRIGVVVFNLHWTVYFDDFFLVAC